MRMKRMCILLTFTVFALAMMFFPLSSPSYASSISKIQTMVKEGFSESNVKLNKKIKVKKDKENKRYIITVSLKNKKDAYNDNAFFASSIVSGYINSADDYYKHNKYDFELIFKAKVNENDSKNTKIADFCITKKNFKKHDWDDEEYKPITKTKKDWKKFKINSAISQNMDDNNFYYFEDLQEEMEDKYSLIYYDEVRNDKTGNWRYSAYSEGKYSQEDIALEYYRAFFKSDKEIHGLWNATTGTMANISVMDGYLDVTIHQYVDNEEHDAALMFSGDVLSEYFINISDGSIEKIR